MKNVTWTVMKGFNSATNVLSWIGYVSLAGIVLVTCVDVVGRYFINKPLIGSLENLELSMTVLGGFAMLYTTTQRGHIRVDLFYVRFSRRIQIILDSFGSLLGFGTWGVITYQVYLIGMRMLKSGRSTNVLLIPLSPFLFIFALGLALYSLALLMETLHPRVSEESKKKEEGIGI